MHKKVAILGINGGFGQVFSSRLYKEDQLEISGIDLSSSLADSSKCDLYRPADLTAANTETGSIIGESDIIIICLPEEVAYKFLELYGSQIPKTALIIDTLSIKSAVSSVYVKNDLNALSLNPMFGPDLKMDDQNIIVIRFKESVLSQLFISYLEQWKLNIIYLTAEEHDKATSVIQAATHAAIIAFGATLKDSGIAISELLKIATPPFLTLGSLYARIASGSKNVYWNIQKENIYAAEARKVLIENLNKLDKSINDGSGEEFGKLLTPYTAEQNESLKQLADHFSAMFRKS